jgi:hypothetical protein
VAIQQIPLDGGLVTQADAEDVGINACTELINLEFDKPGILYKRGGLGVPVTISANINEIIRWVSSVSGVETAYWVICTTNGDVYIDADGLSLSGALSHSGATRIRVINYGNMLRFCGGLSVTPTVYQHIDRDFFWGGYNTEPAFNFDTGRPRAQDFTLIQCGKLNSDYNTSMAHTSKTFRYKVTFVYDGNQESPLPELTPVDNKMAVNLSTTIQDNNIFHFGLQFTESAWNKRITAINVYRQEDSGSFYKICSASTLTTDKDLSVQKANANAHINKVMVDSSGGLTTDINSKELYIDGFGHTIGTRANGQFASMTDSLNAGLSNIWNTRTGHTNLIFDGVGTGTTTGNTEGGWFVGNLVTNRTNGIYDPDASTVSDWGTSNTTVASDATVKKYGTSSIKITTTSGGSLYNRWASYNLNHNSAQEFGESDVLVCSFWFKCFALDPGLGLKACRIFIQRSGGSLTDSNYIVNVDRDIVNTGSNNATIDSGFGWRYVQKEFTMGELDYASGNQLYQLFVYVSPATSGGGVWIDNLVVTKKVYNTTTGKISIGDDVVASTDFDLGSEDGAVGWVSQIGGVTGGIQVVKKNLRYAYQNSGSGLSASTTQTVHVNRSYGWKDVSGNSQFWFLDLGDPNGAVHPTGETSLNVNYTYSVNLEGRQYVAGVALNPSAENEIHEDWVMFSELNQPDVIPITNYISIPDLQGGEIKGLARLLGDLVVLQSRGIFRISIPSASPTSWSLSESESNIGCIAPDSIVEYDSGVFFAGKDNMYYLSANFEAIPITTSIKDVYQMTAYLENTRAIVDVKKNRLLCKFGNSNSTVYALDLTKKSQGIEHWSKIDNSGSKNADLFTINENLRVYAVESGSTSYLVEFDSDQPSENVGFTRKTGWISIGDLDRSGVVRRFNIRHLSHSDITVKFYIDGDTSTVVKTITIPADIYGADWYKCKPNVRCRYFMIELTQPADGEDVEIRRMEVEFE